MLLVNVTCGSMAYQEPMYWVTYRMRVDPPSDILSYSFVHILNKVFIFRSYDLLGAMKHGILNITKKLDAHVKQNS